MKKFTILATILLHVSILLNAQSTSWKGTISTAWHTSTNWTNGVPDSNKHAILGDANFTGSFQPRVTFVSPCKSLTVGVTVPVTLTLVRSLNVLEDLIIGNTGSIMQAASTINLKGNWINNGNFRSYTTGSRVIFSGTNQYIGGSQVSIFRRLVVNNGCTLTLNNHAVVDSIGSLLDISGTINPGSAPAYSLSSTGLTKINPTAKLFIYTPLFTGNYVFSGRTVFYSGSIAEYASNTVEQEVSSTFSYSTLVLSGGTRKYLSANLPPLFGRSAIHGIIEVRDAVFDLLTFTANRANNVVGGQLTVFPGSVIKLSGLNNFPINYATRNLHAGSTVEYYGADQTVSPQLYANLIISGTGNKNALVASTINGNWVLNSSNWNTGTANVTHNFAGDMTMNAGTISGLNGIYQLIGTADQQMAISDTLQRVIVNKNSGKVVLNADLLIGQNVQFSLGNIQTNTNRLRLTSVATVTGASQSTGWVEGFLQRNIPAGTSVSRSFEIGSAAMYAPVNILFSAVSTAGLVEASTTGTEHSEIDYSGIDDTKNVNRFWNIHNISASFSTATIGFNWETSDMDGGADPLIFRPVMYNGNAWTLYSASSPASNSIAVSGLTGFGEFAVGEKLGKSTWSGNDMTADWFTPKNWRGGLPTSMEDALIPSGIQGGRVYPNITTAIGSVKNIEVEPGASLIVDGGRLQIAGQITNNGILDVTNGTVEFNGNSSQIIPAGAFTGNTIKNLIVSNDLAFDATDTITGTLTIAHGKTCNTNNNLVLKSTVLGTARIDELPVDGSGNATAYINGNVSIERFIPARKAWRLLSAPIANGNNVSINQAWQEGSTNQSFGPGDPNPGYGVHITGGTVTNGFDQSPTNLASVKVYQPSSNTFVGIPANPGTYAPIGNHTGYLVYIRGDRSIDLMQGLNAAVTQTTLRMKGTIHTGIKTFPVNATGFTVLGNPYPSAIDFQTLIRNNVKNTFYIWDPKLTGSQGLGGYVTASWNSNTNSYDFTASASPVSQYIPSGEAVLIQSNDGINPGSISIRESDKTSNGSDQWFGRQAPVQSKLNISLYAKDNPDMLDASLVTFNEQGNNGYDEHDAWKFPEEHESIALGSGGHRLAIERRANPKAGDTIFIRLANLEEKSYRIELDQTEWTGNQFKAFVVDRYLKTVALLNGGKGWEFEVNKDHSSADAQRFYIVLSADEPLVKANAHSAVQPVIPAGSSILPYPNPVTGSRVGLKVNNLADGYYQAKLMNSAGIIVWRSSMYIAASKAQTHYLDIHPDLPAGRYELVLQSKDQSVSTALIKQ